MNVDMKYLDETTKSQFKNTDPYIEMGLLILELKSGLSITTNLNVEERYNRLKEHYEKLNIDETEMIDIIRKTRMK